MDSVPRAQPSSCNTQVLQVSATPVALPLIAHLVARRGNSGAPRSSPRATSSIREHGMLDGLPPSISPVAGDGASTRAPCGPNARAIATDAPMTSPSSTKCPVDSRSRAVSP